ncbi:phosphoesterase RecJ domain protein [Alkalidesulfovibrio alkalitolerans DSM 16529]|jgi:nanoRNase/pAp phosphatase (c-di-AMP/oligoRNAs hydrolase)|uniref:Phosphoesterase RecJ domain protein n=1 Tax=Alkalidesulfovibrio alkalitolerans DSM 16529 TaxID=1121439 RepID=S7UT13_9BACT|nr:DHH family phosphoesterase [Alkalidesulfovibrio alkalitolerans]EPR35448.1 phosphoesterase RecJ domain protein [Alkalidesulfovibrio alkalitolerans DSM 16529]
MAYFRVLAEEMKRLIGLLDKKQRWLILMNADPDSMASAMALKRIIGRRVAKVSLAHINEVRRPDNLTMIRTLRIPTHMLTKRMPSHYDRLALVDSQPHHNPAFEGLEFSIVLDHHPLKAESPVAAPFTEIRTEYGACSTLLTEYLYNLGIKPSPLLATALLYGIKSDTQSFERNFCDTDVRAFRHLTKFANQMALKKIVRSEYHLHWLHYFRAALERLEICEHGAYVYMGEVENPDILVILADFFLRVHEINWTAIAGKCGPTLVVIFRGDGLEQDVGVMASEMFGDVGSAGGHRQAARAEIDLKALKTSPEILLCSRFDGKKLQCCTEHMPTATPDA